MTRARLIAALAVPAIAAALLATAGISLSAPTAERAGPSCLGARATIVGTARADVLGGTARRDVIAALGGADLVYGRSGDDLLCGGPGADLLDGGAGRNRVEGGAGADTCLRATRPVGCEKPPPKLPVVEGLTLDGEKLSLADFRGRPVLVNTWASW
jgi:RTX calcium-binding nonapeptide repeat (4 copies)